MKKLFVFVVLFSLLALLACAPKPTAESVVQDVIEKMGGAEKLAAIEDQVSEWDFVMHVMPPGAPEADMEMMDKPQDAEEMADAGHPMPMRITSKRPNKLRMDMMTETGDIVHSSVYDGTKGWVSQMGQQMPMSDVQNQENATMAKTWIDFLANYEEKGITVELLPDEMLGDVNYRVLQATDEFGIVSKYYINAQTNLVEKQVSEMVNYEGNLEPMYMLLKDYQMLEGMLVAQQVEQYMEDGTLIWEASLKEISNNVGISDDVFVSEEMTMK